ncbi:MAG: hypothetical protein EXS48_02040 [Candidatus Staskawiczbacteria bacterium]|nr:hypothetical protein [Candidatus Staskawiczbacteria bacterium]
MLDFFKKYIWFLAGALLLICLLAFFDVAMATGLSLLVFLTMLTFIVLYQCNIRDKRLYRMLLIALVVHSFVVAVLHYTGFNPSPGGADYDGYHHDAVEIALRFKAANFSLQGIPLLHYLPVIIGVVYAITMPTMVVGQLFLVWIVLLSIILLYLLLWELWETGKGFVLVALVAICYPSFLYFSSLLLKDGLVVALSLVGLLLSLKMIKNTTLPLFLAFFATTTLLIHFRFYIGFALLFSCIICWFLLSRLEFSKKMMCGFFMVFLLGFSPQIVGIGYYGHSQLTAFLNEKSVLNYREVAYAPKPDDNPLIQQEANVPPKVHPSFGGDDVSGTGSSVTVHVNFNNKYKFVINYCLSFAHAFFGPFFWQLRYGKHVLFLLETLPWYVLCFFVALGLYRSFKTNGWRHFFASYARALPILVFSLLALGAMSLFINNFGILVRIRTSVFMALLCLLPLGDYSFITKITTHVRNRWYL